MRLNARRGSKQYRSTASFTAAISLVDPSFLRRTRDQLSLSILGDNQPAFPICAIAFFISLSLTSLMWVMTDHSLPNGSSIRALRSP